MFDIPICSKNKDGNLHGECECAVCRNNFDWEENNNADVVVKSISLEGRKVFLDLKVIAKCPHCNYKYEYLMRTREDQYR